MHSRPSPHSHYTILQHTQQETTSQVNLQFLALSKRIQNLFVLADGSAPPRVDPSALLALRLDQLRNININQVCVCVLGVKI